MESTDSFFRKRAQKGDAELEVVRQPLVVGVQESDVLAGRAREAGIAGSRDALVLLANHDHPGIEPGDDGRGVVGRAVVDDDQLPILKALSLYAGDGAHDRVGAIVGRYDYRY